MFEAFVSVMAMVVGMTALVGVALCQAAAHGDRVIELAARHDAEDPDAA